MDADASGDLLDGGCGSTRLEGLKPLRRFPDKGAAFWERSRKREDLQAVPVRVGVGYVSHNSAPSLPIDCVVSFFLQRSLSYANLSRNHTLRVAGVANDFPQLRNSAAIA